MLLSPQRLEQLYLAGRIYTASDADQDDTITGQTAFANTTPTLLLNVPSNKVAIPIHVRLQQAGNVAGGNISVVIEYDNIAAYASDGTAETILSCRTDAPITAECAVYSNPTATAGYGVKVLHKVLMQDVALVATDVGPFDVDWTPTNPPVLVGAASLKVFTWAGTTGPTWGWSVCWAEVPRGWLT